MRNRGINKYQAVYVLIVKTYLIFYTFRAPCFKMDVLKQTQWIRIVRLTKVKLLYKINWWMNFINKDKNHSSTKTEATEAQRQRPRQCKDKGHRNTKTEASTFRHQLVQCNFANNLKHSITTSKNTTAQRQKSQQYKDSGYRSTKTETIKTQRQRPQQHRENGHRSTKTEAIST